MSKNLDTKIRERKDLEARRRGLTRPSRPRPWLRDFDDGTRSDVTRDVWKNLGSEWCSKHRCVGFIARLRETAKGG